MFVFTTHAVLCVAYKKCHKLTKQKREDRCKQIVKLTAVTYASKNKATIRSCFLRFKPCLFLALHGKFRKMKKGNQ